MTARSRYKEIGTLNQDAEFKKALGNILNESGATSEVTGEVEDKNLGIRTVEKDGNIIIDPDYNDYLTPKEHILKDLALIHQRIVDLIRTGGRFEVTYLTFNIEKHFPSQYDELEEVCRWHIHPLAKGETKRYFLLVSLNNITATGVYNGDIEDPEGPYLHSRVTQLVEDNPGNKITAKDGTLHVLAAEHTAHRMLRPKRVGTRLLILGGIHEIEN